MLLYFSYKETNFITYHANLIITGLTLLGLLSGLTIPREKVYTVQNMNSKIFSRRCWRNITSLMKDSPNCTYDDGPNVESEDNRSRNGSAKDMEEEDTDIAEVVVAEMEEG